MECTDGASYLEPHVQSWMERVTGCMCLITRRRRRFGVCCCGGGEVVADWSPDPIPGICGDEEDGEQGTGAAII